MRNGLAVIIGAAVGYCAMLAAIWALVTFSGLIGLPLVGGKAIVIAEAYVEALAVSFVACIPGGIMAALIAMPTWRRKSGIIAGAGSWLLFYLFGEVWTHYRGTPPPKPEMLPIIIGSTIVALLGALGGGLVGAILYEKVKAKYAPKEE